MNWLKKIPLSRYQLIALLCFLAVIAINWSPFGDFLNYNVKNKVEFSLRENLTEPRLDPRIKIFAYDDQTASRLGRLDIDLSDWARVLRHIAAQQPRAILIDKLFDKPYSEAQLKGFASILSDVQVPIYTIAFYSPQEVPLREALTDREQLVAIDQLVAGDLPEWLKPQEGRLYGASQAVLGAVSGVGHAVYEPYGAVKPFYATEEGYALPHWGLRLADAVNVVDGRLRVNERGVTLTRQDQILVNVFDGELYRTRGYSFYPVVSRLLNNKPVDVVAAGDVVVILPAMYTGNTDWRETPHGSMQGGFIMAAIAHSVIADDWLVQLGFDELLIALFVLLIWLLSERLHPVPYVAAVCVISIVIPIVGVACFAYGNLVSPWLMVNSAVAISGVSLFVERMRVAQLEKVRMEADLRTARAVQDSLIPDSLISTPVAEVHGFYRSASECSGDFWGVFDLPQGDQLIVLGDVTGHGVPSALVTAAAFSTIESLCQVAREEERSVGPGKVLSRVSEVLCASKGELTTMTMFASVVAGDGKTVTFANGGQNFPVFLRQELDDDRLQKPGSHYRFRETKHSAIMTISGDLLGITPGSTYSEKTIDLRAGDKLFLYTDGLIENANEAGERIAQRSILGDLEKQAASTATSIQEQLVDRVNSFFGTQELDDDITFVTLAFQVPPRSTP